MIVRYNAYAGLSVSVKNRNDYADYDYIHKLDEKSLNFLKAFNREFVNADFQHKYKKLFKSKRAKKVCNDANNSRNRCLYNKLKWCYDQLRFTKCERNMWNKTSDYYENFLISLIDKERKDLNRNK